MLELKHISKRFQERVIVDDLSIVFPDTGMIGIQGESGSGKSTLLYIIGMLDQDFTGDVYYNGEKIDDQTAFIRQHVSYMMQNKDVISALTVKENIELACMVSEKTFRKNQLQKITNQLGISSLLNCYPSQLSGGQLKRVSIAKALLKQSSLILCDEPTGALHQQQAHEVMDLLQKMSKESLIIIVSHDPKLLKEYCESILTLKNGKLKGRLKKKEKQELKVQKSHHTSLWFYPMRQLLAQRNKLMFLFLFQWIVIVAFFIIVTAMNGVFDVVHKSEAQSVQVNMMSIEKKDGTPFDNPITNALIQNVQYNTHLEQLSVTSQGKDVSCVVQYLPMLTQHIQLEKGYLPTAAHEILVSKSLYQKLQQVEVVEVAYHEQKIPLQVVGILPESLFSGDELYCSPLLKTEISDLNNPHILLIESKDGKARELYQQLSQDYFVYSDVIERVDNYQSLLSLAQMVSYIFIGVSFLISLLLIAIVESTIYLERQHDVAYLLSLGLQRQKLMVLSFGEAMLLGSVMAIGGCLCAGLIYYYLNHVYQIAQHFYVSLVLKTIWFCEYDLFIVILLSYMLMTMLGCLMPMKRMMKTNMIDVLREE